LQVPDLLLERYRLGEMSPPEIEELRRRLAADEGLRARLRALDDSDREINHRYPPGWMAARIRQRLRTDSHPAPIVRRRLTWRLPVSAGAAAVLVMVVGWQVLGPRDLEPGRRPSNTAESGVRLKGDSLVLFRKTAEGSEVLGDGALARAGDQIRIGYRAARRSYGMILSIDGRGVVTRHFPRQGRRAALLTATGLVLLDHAFELDDAPRWERFYLVSSREAFEVAPVLEAARTVAASAGTNPPPTLVLPAPLDQSGLVLIKEATR
jgi:hypothetical protein